MDFENDIEDGLLESEKKEIIDEVVINKPVDMDLLKILATDFSKANKSQKIFRKKQKKEDTILNITSSNVHAAYAMIRIANCDRLTKWPPRILEIKHYIDNQYQRKTLCTELVLAMIELCLNVPIQYDLIRDGKKISLSDPNNINYEDKCFENAIEIILDLLKSGIIQENDLRIPREILDQRSV